MVNRKAFGVGSYKGWLLILLVGAFGLFHSDALAAKRALVYKGPGACDGCDRAAYQIALKAGFDPTYVSETQLNAASTEEDKAELFRDVAVWLQPGGKSSIAMTSMTSELISTVKKYIEQGVGYVGFCAGAFSSTRLVGTTDISGFNFMPGKTILYSAVEDAAAIIPITWNGEVRHIYWEGGPYMTELPPGKAEAIAFYPNGQVATSRSKYGKGRVFVTGAHPEATKAWRRDYGLDDPDGDDHDLAIEMVNWVTQ